MKFTSFAFAMLSFLNVAAAAGLDVKLDPPPTCYLYDQVNPSRQAQLLPSTPISEAMANANGTAGAYGPNSYKYQVEGVTAELTQSFGCTESCWSLRQIMVTTNGVSIHAEAAKETLGNFYPTFDIIVKDKKLTLQCYVSGGK